MLSDVMQPRGDEIAVFKGARPGRAIIVFFALVASKVVGAFDAGEDFSTAGDVANLSLCGGEWSLFGRPRS